MKDLEHAINLIDNLQISEFFLFMRKKTGNDATLTRLENMFMQNKTDADFYEQLKTYAISKFSANKKQNYTHPNSENSSEKPQEQVGARYSFLISVCLTLGGFAYLLAANCISEQAFFIFRFILPLGFAALGAWLPGSVGVSNSYIKAAGAVALLVLAYVWNPAETHFKAKACYGTLVMEGIVKLNGKMLKKIAVNCPELEKNGVTDDVFGKFKYTDINAEKLDNLDSLTFFADGFREKKCFLNRKKDPIFVEITLSEEDRLEEKMPDGDEKVGKTTINFPKNNNPKVSFREIEFSKEGKPLTETDISIDGQAYKTDKDGKVKIPENLLKNNKTKILIRSGSENWDKIWNGESEFAL
jgi:hypothetical protein